MKKNDQLIHRFWQISKNFNSCHKIIISYYSFASKTILRKQAYYSHVNTYDL